ncbi:MAG: nucleotidyltransferase domain-containing protein [Candidatus Omnitrophica bacterium]|nr:nucleotidyltransferase domain-containing protein [Candidatus Omnitrophota bacterium]
MNKLRKDFSIERIYLYGSFAKGEIHEGSDIDLIIVGNFKGSMFERIKQIIALTDLPIEPLVYTPEEFSRMCKDNPFIKGVINGKGNRKMVG